MLRAYPHTPYHMRTRDKVKPTQAVVLRTGEWWSASAPPGVYVVTGSAGGVPAAVKVLKL
jgi:hypothetical protein